MIKKLSNLFHKNESKLESEQAEVYGVQGNEIEQGGTWKGIKNMGATCYISTILQLWFHVPEFRKRILSASNSNDIVEMLQKVLLELQFSVSSAIDISPLVKLLQIDPAVQQDALEFYRLLSRFIEFEHGVSMYNTRCETCTSVRSNQQPFTQLELNIDGKRKTIEECISSFLGLEELGDMYNCVNCGPSKASRFVSIQNFPKVLCLQILRFKTSFERGQFLKKKSSCIVEFPPILDMSAHGGPKYELIGVLVHHGTIDRGHYISNMKTAYQLYSINKIMYRKGWYQFDDAVCVPLETNTKNVFDLVQNKGRSIPFDDLYSSKNVYMLAYLEHEQIPKSTGSEDDPLIIDEDVRVIVKDEEVPKKLQYLIDKIYEENKEKKEALKHEKEDKIKHFELKKKSLAVQRRILELIERVADTEHYDDDWIFIPENDILTFFQHFQTEFSYNKCEVRCQHGSVKDEKNSIILPPDSLSILPFTIEPMRVSEICKECKQLAAKKEEYLKKHVEHVEEYRKRAFMMEDGEGLLSKRWLFEWIKKTPDFSKYEVAEVQGAEDLPIAIEEPFNICPNSYPFKYDVLCPHGSLNPDNLFRKASMIALRYLEKEVFPNADNFIVREGEHEICCKCVEFTKLKKYLQRFTGKTSSGIHVQYLQPKFSGTEYMIPYVDGHPGKGELKCVHGLLKVNPREWQTTAGKFSDQGYLILSASELSELKQLGYTGEYIQWSNQEEFCKECNTYGRALEFKVSIECRDGTVAKRRKRELSTEIGRNDKISLLKMKIAQLLQCTSLEFSLFSGEECMDEWETCEMLLEGSIITCKMLTTYDYSSNDDENGGFEGTLLIG